MKIRLLHSAAQASHAKESDANKTPVTDETVVLSFPSGDLPKATSDDDAVAISDYLSLERYGCNYAESNK